MRNAAITTVAPTGTLSMIADVSSGIEPFFSLVYTKTVLGGQDFIYVNKYLEDELRKRGLYNDAIIYKIKEAGTLQGIEDIPDDLKRVFVVSSDISPEWHIRMQAVFQKRVHSAVSKTVNMPNNATIEDVAKAYRLAYDLKCKGLTIYRDGSRQVQVLTKGGKTPNQEKITAKENPAPKQKTMVEVPRDECPVCKKKMVAKEGCMSCHTCGYSKCSVN
jgi:ribonucleoside-diphosphate reductase alpha chain